MGIFSEEQEEQDSEPSVIPWQFSAFQNNNVINNGIRS
jgi:hypothetical protein